VSKLCAHGAATTAPLEWRQPLRHRTGQSCWRSYRYCGISGRVGGFVLAVLLIPQHRASDPKWNYLAVIERLFVPFQSRPHLNWRSSHPRWVPTRPPAEPHSVHL